MEVSQKRVRESLFEMFRSSSLSISFKPLEFEMINESVSCKKKKDPRVRTGAMN